MKSCCLMLGHIIGAHLVYTPGLLKLAQPLPLSTRHIYIVWCSPLFVDVMLYIMHGWQNMNNQWHCNAVSSRSRRLVAISSTDLLTTPIYTIVPVFSHLLTTPIRKALCFTRRPCFTFTHLWMWSVD